MKAMDFIKLIFIKKFITKDVSKIETIFKFYVKTLLKG